MRCLPGCIAGCIDFGVGVTQFEVDDGGLGLGFVVVACGQVGQGDGIEIALGSVGSGNDSGGSGQSSSDGDELHFEWLGMSPFVGRRI